MFARQVTLGRLATDSGTHPHAVRADYEDLRDSAVARGVAYDQAEADALAAVVDKYTQLAAHRRRLARPS